jgi:hypothetical protein
VSKKQPDFTLSELQSMLDSGRHSNDPAPQAIRRLIYELLTARSEVSLLRNSIIAHHMIWQPAIRSGAEPHDCDIALWAVVGLKAEYEWGKPNESKR